MVMDYYSYTFNTLVGFLDAVELYWLWKDF